MGYVRKGNPGSALPRATGAKREIEMDRNSHLEIYATCTDLQRRHVMQRCGLGAHRAGLIASFVFREDGK